MSATEPRQFEPLLAAAASAGFALDVSSSKTLADSLDGAVRVDDAYFNTLVRMMATRCGRATSFVKACACALPHLPSSYKQLRWACTQHHHPVTFNQVAVQCLMHLTGA